MTRRRRRIAGRDQRVSPFSVTLLRLCDATGAVGAALVDSEGETVDYAGVLDPFDIKIAAAEWMVVLAQLKASALPAFRDTTEVFLRGTKKSFCLFALADGYGLVLELPTGAYAISRRALHEAMRELCAEAALDPPASVARDREPWWRVEVRSDPLDRRRPAALWIAGAWSRIEILGRWRTHAAPREVGYRARLASGAEVMLVRERLGRWYADSPLGR